MAALILTAKQARFVQEYLVDGNGAGAAVRAGYSPRSAKVAACRMLTKDNPVRKAIEARQQAEAKRLGVSRQKVVAQLLEAFEMARMMVEPAAMVAASRELGRLFGFYAPDRVIVAEGAGLQREMAVMSDGELMEMVALGAEAGMNTGESVQPVQPVQVFS